jgi:hypothetical protein
MPLKDNQIDIRDHQTVAISVGDLRAIVTLLECATSHLILPDEATHALDKLRGLIDSR